MFTRTAMTSQNTPVPSDLQTGGHNESTPEGCFRIRFSEWEYLPWDNPDNVVGQDVQLYATKVRTNLLVILFLIGGPANVINMAVFFKQGLKDRVNLLLFSLSLADELYLLASLVTYFEEFCFQFSGKTHIGPFFTILVNSMFAGFHGFCYVSYVLSATIACERCCCVLWPLRYQTLMRTGTLAVIIVAVYGIVTGLYFVVASKYHIGCAYDSDIGVAFNTFIHTEFYRHNMDLIDNLDNVFFGAGLPTAVMVVVATATAITITKLRQAVAWRTETASSVSAKEVALTKMLVGTSVLLIACISPGWILRVASLFWADLNAGQRKENVYFTCLWITQMFVYINGSFNIFVYYRMGTRYRESIRALFQRKATRQKLSC